MCQKVEHSFDRDIYLSLFLPSIPKMPWHIGIWVPLFGRPCSCPISALSHFEILESVRHMQQNTQNHRNGQHIGPTTQTKHKTEQETKSRLIVIGWHIRWSVLECIEKQFMLHTYYGNVLWRRLTINKLSVSLNNSIAWHESLPNFVSLELRHVHRFLYQSKSSRKWWSVRCWFVARLVTMKNTFVDDLRGKVSAEIE